MNQFVVGTQALWCAKYNVTSHFWIPIKFHKASLLLFLITSNIVLQGLDMNTSSDELMQDCIIWTQIKSHSTAPLSIKKIAIGRLLTIPNMITFIFICHVLEHHFDQRWLLLSLHAFRAWTSVGFSQPKTADKNIHEKAKSTTSASEEKFSSRSSKHSTSKGNQESRIGFMHTLLTGFPVPVGIHETFLQIRWQGF